jgi:hypothetical protein
MIGGIYNEGTGWKKTRSSNRRDIVNKKTISLNSSLEKLAEDVVKASGRAGKFSARLGDIAERYELILRLTPAPELTDAEKLILDEAIRGGGVSLSSIRHMDELVMDCASGSIDERIALHDKVTNWAPVERIAVIEQLGL